MKILKAKPDLNRDIIEKWVRLKKRQVGKLLTDEGAGYMVANDLGIDLSKEKTLKTKITIKDLEIGVSNVSLSVKVLSIDQIRTFNRKNGSKGQVARIVIGDDTGIINSVLWDEKADIIKNRLSEGDLIRINNAYVKSDLEGRPELNVGSKGSIEILHHDFRSKHFEKFSGSYTMSQDLKKGEYINFRGAFVKSSSTYTFSRNNGAKGRVVRAKIADKNGIVAAVFWDDKTELIQKVSRGESIEILNGHVREGLTGKVEIHVRKESEISILPQGNIKKIDLPPFITQIENLSSNMYDVDVLARIIDIGEIREFQNQSGKKGKVGEVVLIDQSGSVKLLLWNEKVDLINNISIGDTILVESVYTRKDYMGSITLNLGKMGKIQINPALEETKNLPQCTNVEKIGKLQVGFLGLVQGRISEEPIGKLINTRDGRELKLVSLRIKDDTGEIRVTFWEKLAEMVSDLTLNTKIMIKNAYVKSDFSGELIISSRSRTKIEIGRNQR